VLTIVLRAALATFRERLQLLRVLLGLVGKELRLLPASAIRNLLVVLPQDPQKETRTLALYSLHRHLKSKSKRTVNDKWRKTAETEDTYQAHNRGEQERNSDDQPGSQATCDEKQWQQQLPCWVLSNVKNDGCTPDGEYKNTLCGSSHFRPAVWCWWFPGSAPTWIGVAAHRAAPFFSVLRQLFLFKTYRDVGRRGRRGGPGYSGGGPR
jgi:hypothetical protein